MMTMTTEFNLHELRVISWALKAYKQGEGSHQYQQYKTAIDGAIAKADKYQQQWHDGEVKLNKLGPVVATMTERSEPEPAAALLSSAPVVQPGLGALIDDANRKVDQLRQRVGELEERFGAEGVPEWSEVDKRIIRIETTIDRIVGILDQLPKLEKRINAAAMGAEQAIDKSKRVLDQWGVVVDRMNSNEAAVTKMTGRMDKIDQDHQKLMAGVPQLLQQGHDVLGRLSRLDPVELKHANDLLRKFNFENAFKQIWEAIEELRNRPAHVAAPVSRHPYRDDTGAIPQAVFEQPTGMRSDGDIVFKLPRALNKALQALVSAYNEYRQFGGERGIVMAAQNVVQVFEDYRS